MNRRQFLKLSFFLSLSVCMGVISKEEKAAAESGLYYFRFPHRFPEYAKRDMNSKLYLPIIK